MSRLRNLLRDARYALPQKIERFASGPGAAVTLRRCRALRDQGLEATIGYFQAAHATPDQIIAANLALLGQWQASGGKSYLSVKAPPLHFDPLGLERLAAAAAASDTTLLFDSHALHDAEATLASVERLIEAYPGTGFALPARWGRSKVDALRFRESSARIRIVKGEYADPGFSGDVEASYLALAVTLAGRKAPVMVATHDPSLAERALTVLVNAGTVCELEQLRGLPGRRTRAVAERLGVPIRIYVPFGPGWWPYALDKALGRPYLLSWWLRDRLGVKRAAGGPRPMREALSR
jgi:proline dehydrogenase